MESPAAGAERDRQYPCQCCGSLTLSEPGGATYRICPACFWEDDPVQNADPAFAGGANRLCLNEARRLFRDFCATEPGVGLAGRSAAMESLRVAGEKMQELIAAAGTSEDELVEDFKKLRRQRRLQRT